MNASVAVTLTDGSTCLRGATLFVNPGSAPTVAGTDAELLSFPFRSSFRDRRMVRGSILENPLQALPVRRDPR